MNIFHLKWTGCTINSMYNQQHKNFYLNADPQKMSCANDSENKGKRMAQAHSHPGMPSAGARASQPYYIQGGILTQRCSEGKLSKVRAPGRWSSLGGRRTSGSRGRGEMGGRPERESLRSGWALFRMQDRRRSQEKGRQTLEIRETVATTQAKHRREDVKGTRSWITFSRAPSNPLSWLLPSWEAFTTMLLKVGPQTRDVSITWALACWLSPPPAAAAKSLQSCPTLCDPIDGSPPGSPVPGILQARTMEWVAISFSNAWKWSGSNVSDS